MMYDSKIYGELTSLAIILIIAVAVAAAMVTMLLFVYFRTYRQHRLTAESNRETERELLKSRERLAIREREYDTLVRELDEGFCVIDLISDRDHRVVDYRFVEVNPAFAKHTDIVDPVGKRVRELIPTIDDSWLESYGRVAQSGESVRFESAVTSLGRLYNVFAYRIGGEGSTRVGVLFSDITKRRKMETLLRDVQRREAVGVLSAGIAHDFNNLLGVMMGHVSLAKMKLPDSHPAFTHMTKALVAMESAADLTRQILAYAGKGNYLYLKIDLGAEIAKDVGLFTMSKPKNVRLQTELPTVPVFVTGDPGQIKQVIMNLIINGGEAIGGNQGTIVVRLSHVMLTADEAAAYAAITDNTLRAGPYALLEVEDTGVGMSPEVMKNIFDPFFTTKFAGRGLGLSAALGIIRSHGGGLCIDSTPGVGTTFHIILPLSMTEAPMHDGQDAMHDGNAAIEPAGTDPPVPARILIIDDEEDVAAMARDILALDHYAVTVVVNPIEAIEYYRKDHDTIDIVLLDMTMPELSGRDVAGHLKAIDPAVKIIISSGYTQEDVVSRMGSVTASGFIQKPYKAPSLLTIVKTLLHAAPEAGNPHVSSIAPL